MGKTTDDVKGWNDWAPHTSKKSGMKAKSRVRISMPPGEDMKLFNGMAEISAPGGFDMVIKLPFPMGDSGFTKFLEPIRGAGGTVEIENL